MPIFIQYKIFIMSYAERKTTDSYEKQNIHILDKVSVQ